VAHVSPAGWARIDHCQCRAEDTIGAGSGESLNRLPVGPHELILADAGYCSIAGIEYVWQHGADVLVRVNPQSFMAYSAHGKRISLLPRLRTLSKVGQFGEWQVVFQGEGSAFTGRLCAVRKSDSAIQQAHRRLQRKASKKQMITRPGTLEFAKYVIVFTTRSSGSAADVLRSYRMRWQIELVFKRLKSLAQLGHVPKHDDRSSRAWLYGKLLVTLLTQKLIRIGRDICPSGNSGWARGTI
jgi:Transposase DDE domain